jgi:preprotein translocase subunit SecD
MRLHCLLPVALLGALVFAGAASAGTPRFALFDVHTDLAQVSHNTFGDVKIWKRQAALTRRAGDASVVRCGGDCTFGAGWLAFTGAPALSAGDIVSAKAHRTKVGWSVALTLTQHGASSWKRFARQASLSGAARGVPDALAVVLDGTIVAQPLASQVRQGGTAVQVPGLSRKNALRVATLLAR